MTVPSGQGRSRVKSTTPSVFATAVDCYQNTGCQEYFEIEQVQADEGRGGPGGPGKHGVDGSKGPRRTLGWPATQPALRRPRGIHDDPLRGPPSA